MMTSYFRIGGLAADVPDELVEGLEAFVREMPRRIDDYAGQRDRPAADATSSILKIVSGRWSDRAGIRKPIVVLGYALSSADISKDRKFVRDIDADHNLEIQLGQLAEKRGRDEAFGPMNTQYRCADGVWVAISSSSDSVARRVLALIGLGDDADSRTW